MRSNIALIGFMGVGKSTAGQVLAGRIGKNLVETDALVERKAGKAIPRIFREDGEIAFRELEITVIKEIAGRKNQVIACGGGVPLNRINIDRLKQDSIIIWLTASPAVVAKRTGMNLEARPLLQGIKGIEDIAALLKFRKPFYDRAADVIINTSRLETREVVEQILDKIEENADNNL
jgi:shikimate kinase